MSAAETAAAHPAATPSTFTNPPTASTPSKPPIRLTLDKTTLLCDKAVLAGNITIGAGTVIHPRARLLATSPSSSVTIGANCVIEENAMISAPAESALTVGNWNLIECNAAVYSSIGHANYIRTGAEITAQGRVGRGVEVGMGVVVDGKVDDGSVLLPGDLGERRVAELPGAAAALKDREKRIMETVQLNLVLLRDTLPKHNKFIH